MIRSYEIWWIMYIWPKRQKTFRHLDNGPVIVDVGHKGQSSALNRFAMSFLMDVWMTDEWMDVWMTDDGHQGPISASGGEASLLRLLLLEKQNLPDHPRLHFRLLIW